MALHTRYNDNGTKILCELKDISQLESNGYKHKESPIEAYEQDYEFPENKTVKRVAKEAQPKKTTRRSTRKSSQSNEKDIIL